MLLSQQIFYGAYLKFLPELFQDINLFKCQLKDIAWGESDTVAQMTLVWFSLFL